jgi:uncharacterized RDD family membrane protein YckC
VVTPEGVPLAFAIAPAGDRAAAFLVDAALIFAGVVAVVLLGAVASDGGGWVWAVVQVSVFLLVNAYFLFFESRGQGATPGKRRLGIRVIDARGGALSVEAVIARNLVRDLEVFLPLVALASPESLWPGAPPLARAASVVWLAVFALLPLFNRQRLRVGDLVAGTCVVLAPRVVLLEDPGRARAGAGRRAAPDYSFDDAQLDVYGIYELQVLEDVLRRAGREDGPAALRVVAKKIAKKIRWTGPVADVEGFLRAFYAALRDRLERRLLLGQRKADKHSR